MSNKAHYLANYLDKNNLNTNGLVYSEMILMTCRRCGSLDSLSHRDAHAVILDEADVILSQRGGDGFVRAFMNYCELEKMSADEVAELF